jgi:hypothetical protein
MFAHILKVVLVGTPTAAILSLKKEGNLVGDQSSRTSCPKRSNLDPDAILLTSVAQG